MPKVQPAWKEGLESGSMWEVESDKGISYLQDSSIYSCKESWQKPWRNHTGTVSIGGWNMMNLQFANDIDGLAGSEDELWQLLKHLEDTRQSYGMLINTSKTKVMSNTSYGFIDEITIKDQTLEDVESFKYLRSVFSDKGSRPELLTRIMMTSQAVVRLKVVWHDRKISIATKVETPMNTCATYISLCLWDMDTDFRHPKEN